MKLLFVRHCESSGQAPDAALTETGREQARVLADFLADFEIDRLVSSPFRRALQTIEVFAERRRLVVDVEPRLRERRLCEQDLSDWRAHIERSYQDLDYRAPGGETGREARERGWQAVEELTRGPQQHPLIVTHGNLLTLLLGRIDPELGFEFWKGLSNPDAFEVDFAQSRAPSLRRIWSLS